MRGEYCIRPEPVGSWGELPPRARRIQCRPRLGAHVGGTTSACAENTANLYDLAVIPGNYLRVRGEYSTWYQAWRPGGELPPRARRIRYAQPESTPLIGTTSACAENTAYSFSACAPHQNYLRVRGEYNPTKPKPPRHQELPPRARRIRLRFKNDTSIFGTTSACAENTLNELGLL